MDYFELMEVIDSIDNLMKKAASLFLCQSIEVDKSMQYFF